MTAETTKELKQIAQQLEEQAAENLTLANRIREIDKQCKANNFVLSKLSLGTKIMHESNENVNYVVNVFENDLLEVVHQPRCN